MSSNRAPLAAVEVGSDLDDGHITPSDQPGPIWQPKETALQLPDARKTLHSSLLDSDTEPERLPSQETNIEVVEDEDKCLDTENTLVDVPILDKLHSNSPVDWGCPGETVDGTGEIMESSEHKKLTEIGQWTEIAISDDSEPSGQFELPCNIDDYSLQATNIPDFEIGEPSGEVQTQNLISAPRVPHELSALSDISEESRTSEYDFPYHEENCRSTETGVIVDDNSTYLTITIEEPTGALSDLLDNTVEEPVALEVQGSLHEKDRVLWPEHSDIELETVGDNELDTEHLLSSSRPCTEKDDVKEVHCYSVPAATASMDEQESREDKVSTELPKAIISAEGTESNEINISEVELLPVAELRTVSFEHQSEQPECLDIDVSREQMDHDECAIEVFRHPEQEHSLSQDTQSLESDQLTVPKTEIETVDAEVFEVPREADQHAEALAVEADIPPGSVQKYARTFIQERFRNLSLRRLFYTGLIKYVLFFFNFICWVAGVVAASVGYWLIVEKHKVVRDAIDFFLDPSIILCVSGFIISLVAFFGCLGALRENITLLKIWHITLSVFLVAELVFGALVFVFYFFPGIRKSLKLTPAEWGLKEAIIKYQDDDTMRKWIDMIQTEMKCCGVTDSDEGYRDWQENVYYKCDAENPSSNKCSVPPSCCVLEPGDYYNTMCGYETNNKELYEIEARIYTQGCVQGFGKWLKRNAVIIGAVFAGVVVPQFLGIVLAHVFIQLTRKKQVRARWKSWKDRSIAISTPVDIEPEGPQPTPV